ncbi:MAG TPA: cytochrome c [Aestuariivirgaceae bacterium]|nr:cytochrome c [Aestuariivirgaceae bacterium]
MDLAKPGLFVVLLALAACSEAAPPAHLAIPGADPDRGRALIADYGCGTCHFVEGVTGADGLVAPPLENFANRTLLAGTFPNVPRFLVPWLIDPPDLKPETAMPNLGVSDTEARDIASYLYTLGSADTAPQVQAAVADVDGQAYGLSSRLQRERLQEGLGIDRAMELLASD